MGLKYLVKAGYGGEGLLKILKKMREKQWFGSNQIPSYLQTHPAIEARMAYLDTAIQAHPEWRTLNRSKTQGDFAKVRIKLIAAYGDPDTAKDTLDAMLRENPGDAFANAFTAASDYNALACNRRKHGNLLHSYQFN